MIDLEIEFADLERIKNAVGSIDKVADQSMTRALRRTERWLSTRVKNEIVAANEGLKAGSLKTRIKLGGVKDGKLYARVWVGLNPMPAGGYKRVSGAKPGSNKGVKGGSKRGRPGGAGVKVGAIRFPHAFILGKRVVRRTTTKRYPLENVTIPIADKANKALVKKAWPDAQRYFLNEFERLLRLELSRIERNAS